jgi:hypothetical protein
VILLLSGDELGSDGLRRGATKPSWNGIATTTIEYKLNLTLRVLSIKELLNSLKLKRSSGYLSV